jgi:hypothetical protein
VICELCDNPKIPCFLSLYYPTGTIRQRSFELGALLPLFQNLGVPFSQAESGPVLAKASEHREEDESQKATSPFMEGDEEQGEVKDGSNCDFAVPIRGPRRTQTSPVMIEVQRRGPDPSRALRFRLWRSVMSP